MGIVFRWAVLLAVFMAPIACTTTREKAPSITESEPAMEEKREAPEAKKSRAEEELTAPPEAMMPPPKPEVEERAAPKTPLAGGASLHGIVVEENTLKLSPQKVTIFPGDTVRWQNKDNKKHFLASVPGSGTTDQLEIFSLMEPGNVYEHTFKAAGEYPYFCFIHNQMTGHITVTE
jgi:plastocyanin